MKIKWLMVSSRKVYWGKEEKIVRLVYGRLWDKPRAIQPLQSRLGLVHKLHIYAECKFKDTELCRKTQSIFVKSVQAFVQADQTSPDVYVEITPCSHKQADLI